MLCTQDDKSSVAFKKTSFSFSFFSKYKQDKKHEIYKAVAEILGKVD